MKKVWFAHDGGRAINPILVEGQVEGSIYMGLGEVLMEENTFRKQGLHRGPSLLDYKSPIALEIPPMEVFLVQSSDPEGPFGAKEVGQGHCCQFLRQSRTLSTTPSEFESTRCR